MPGGSVAQLSSSPAFLLTLIDQLPYPPPPLSISLAITQLQNVTFPTKPSLHHSHPTPTMSLPYPFIPSLTGAHYQVALLTCLTPYLYCSESSHMKQDYVFKAHDECR